MHARRCDTMTADVLRTALTTRQEQAQLAAMREQMAKETKEGTARADKDFEGGFGGQEDLEDRYATTSGEH